MKNVTAKITAMGKLNVCRLKTEFNLKFGLSEATNPAHVPPSLAEVEVLQCTAISVLALLAAAPDHSTTNSQKIARDFFKCFDFMSFSQLK